MVKAGKAFALIIIITLIHATSGCAKSEKTKADEFYRKKDYQNALIHYEKALQKNPSDSDAIEGYALSLYKKAQNESATPENWKRVTDALEKANSAKRSEETKSALAHSYFMLAMSYNMKGDYKNAIEEIKKAIAIDPSNPQYHLNLFMIYQRAGMKEEALEEMKIYRELTGGEKKKP